MFRTTLILLTLLSQCFLPWGSRVFDTSQVQDVETWIEMPKTEYKMCEQTGLFLFIVNLGEDTLRIPRINEIEWSLFEVDLLNPEGEKLKYTGITPPHVFFFTLLPPLDTVLFIIDLTDGYSPVYALYTKFPLHFPPGRYRVSGTLLGRFQTNELSFEVQPLTPEEEELVAKFNSTSRRLRGMAKIADEYWRLMKENFDSPMDPQRQVYLEQYWLSLLQRYPDALRAKGAVYYLMKTKNDRELRRFFSSEKAHMKHRYVHLYVKQVARELGKEHLFEEVFE